ncbi:MAG: translation initiation factor IF-3 [Flavobacteriales bacterium]|nr:translation initiation factor IF-3 [Flavobacteriales bacterium]
MAEVRNFENKGRFDRNKSNQDAHRVNERIFAKEVRVIAEGIEPKVYSIAKALEIAREMELDLVEISPNAVPPVCKIVDYKKFLYDQKKKQKEIKAKAQKVEVKEIRFGPNTDDHDFDFKVKHAIKFINEGSKVKAFVFFKGRSIVFKDRGEILLLKMAQAMEEIAIVESMPKLEGKKMFIFLAPKKKK